MRGHIFHLKDYRLANFGFQHEQSNTPEPRLTHKARTYASIKFYYCQEKEFRRSAPELLYSHGHRVSPGRKSQRYPAVRNYIFFDLLLMRWENVRQTGQIKPHISFL